MSRDNHAAGPWQPGGTVPGNRMVLCLFLRDDGQYHCLASRYVKSEGGWDLPGTEYITTRDPEWWAELNLSLPVSLRRKETTAIREGT